MGWNQLERDRPSRLLEGVGDTPYVYFAHSYYCPVVPRRRRSAITSCRTRPCSKHENIYGVQFHPEKSGALGLAIVRNFVESTEC